jgi:hypothetical protein
MSIQRPSTSTPLEELKKSWISLVQKLSSRDTCQYLFTKIEMDTKVNHETYLCVLGLDLSGYTVTPGHMTHKRSDPFDLYNHTSISDPLWYDDVLSSVKYATAGSTITI